MSQKTKKFDVVVVIPFYNEEKYIRKTLLCLLNQRVSSTIFWHVLFVNNKSTDNTVKIINDYLKKASLSYSIINELRKGTVYSRKIGLIKASELSDGIILSTDADTVFPKHFIAKTYVDLNKSKANVLVGRRKKNAKVSLWERFVSKDIFNYRRKIWNLEYLIFGPYFFGAYFAIKASFFKKIPLYNPEAHEYFMGEDIHLSRRSYYCGGKFIKSTAAVYPNDRRTFSLKEENFANFVGNKNISHIKKYSKNELVFKKLLPEKENEYKNKLIGFETKRFLWMICDAYLFWIYTDKKYYNAHKVVKRSLRFVGIPHAVFENTKIKLTQKNLYFLLQKKYFEQAVFMIGQYLNAQK